MHPLDYARDHGYVRVLLCLSAYSRRAEETIYGTLWKQSRLTRAAREVCVSPEGVLRACAFTSTGALVWAIRRKVKRNRRPDRPASVCVCFSLSLYNQLWANVQSCWEAQEQSRVCHVCACQTEKRPSLHFSSVKYNWTFPRAELTRGKVWTDLHRHASTDFLDSMSQINHEQSITHLSKWTYSKFQ